MWTTVSRRLIPASDRQVKTSQLEKGEIRPTDLPAAVPQKEARGGESTQDGESAVDTVVTCARLAAATFRLLYVFVVLSPDRRRVVHFNGTDNPSAA